MDVKTLLQNLHEELCCPVCKNTFTNPKQLPCLHSFCLHCLNELQRTSGTHGKIICPECRRDFRIRGSGKPKELPTNFRLNSLLDVYQIFSSDGTYLRCFGRPGCQEGEFDEPRGIAFLDNENIAVADSYNDRVQIFSGQGEYLTQFGGEGNLDHQLQSPFGLSVSGDGNIIVADTGNKLIKIFSPCGQFLSKLAEKTL